jgi:hypothetical protein
LESRMNQLFKEQKSVHVLYSYKRMDNYIKQAVDFTLAGIAAGDSIILIENDPVYRMIHKELSTMLTKDEMESVHFINSFDFYYSSGSYHPPAITEYFTKMVQPYVENN